ncbi:MAG: hypothetical protein LBM77_08900 [Spirochaetaceae bacterium]|jgi:hypothetical protein|nr:hypothetical protein [Spirochaetaceae bacterium]
MRVAVISAPASRQAPPDYVQSLAKGIESMGHSVEVLDAWTDDGHRLPGFEYIVCCSGQTGIFGGKLPECLGNMLGTVTLEGKKGAAFLKKNSPFSGKAMANLMRLMEKQGMFVNWSEILLSPTQAEAIGKRIGS